MSTKIFDAYRVRPDADLWTVLRDIEAKAKANVIEKLRAFYIEKMEGIDPESEAYRKSSANHRDGSEAFNRLWLVDEIIRERARESATSLKRDEYDLDVSIAITQHRTGYYLRAFCDNASMLGGSLDFLAQHPDLEDFHYQNQTDPPEDVSDEAWEERKAIWNEMASDHGFFPCQLGLEISNWGMFWRLNPMLDLAREFKQNPPVFPSREELAARVLRKLDALQDVTAAPGRIVCLTKEGVTVTISKATKASQKGQWITRIGDQLKRHGDLGRAADHVYLTFCADWFRRSFARLMRRAKQQRRGRAKRKQGSRASSCSPA